jgi:general secretion pathway protein G
MYITCCRECLLVYHQPDIRLKQSQHNRILPHKWITVDAMANRMQLTSFIRRAGFTLLELIVTLAIIAVLGSLVIVLYTGYTERTKVTNAAQQITIMAIAIKDYQSEFGKFPSTLQDVSLERLRDPWGNPYRYLNIAEAANPGMVRKDHNLVPLNTDYDLYSVGKDGQTFPPLTAKASQDDVVRANNGAFVGLASDY